MFVGLCVTYLDILVCAAFQNHCDVIYLDEWALEVNIHMMNCILLSNHHMLILHYFMFKVVLPLSSPPQKATDRSATRKKKVQM